MWPLEEPFQASKEQGQKPGSSVPGGICSLDSACGGREGRWAGSWETKVPIWLLPGHGALSKPCLLCPSFPL